MRVLVFGAGALGCVVGGFLKKYGVEVALVGREEVVSAINREGLFISGIWGNHHVKGFEIATYPLEEWKGKFDLVVISVKSYDTEVAVKSILPILREDTFVCSYQNGLGNVEKIAEYVGMERTVPARVIFGSKVIKPGFVQVTVIAEPTALGRFDGGPKEEVVKSIVRLMDGAGIPTFYHENIMGLIWAKVAYNSALNPLSAILDVPYGRLLETEETVQIMEEVICELYAVAKCKNVPMIIPTPEGYIKHLFNELIPPTAQHYASMREDLKLGRRTEIDALNGAIWRLGEELGVRCPVNRYLTAIVKGKEKLSICNGSY
ncbi:MAG: ketopantoate reductase family protein [Candidatus Hydrogenedentes bacterium]|nr:ketopantoate reductase family protein [Candidatus Hydrogenedentota bacterium]